MGKSPDAFRTISEVADLLDVPAHVLRFWESRFTQIKPVKGAGGRRYYRRSDILLLDGIRRLLHDDGLTIRGVQKLLREEGVRRVAAHGRIDIGGDEDTGLAVGAMDEVPEAPMAADVEPEEGRILTFPLRRRGPQILRAGQPQPVAESAAPAETGTPDVATGFAEAAPAPYPAAAAAEAITPPPRPESSDQEQDMTAAPSSSAEDDFARRFAGAAFEDTGPLIEAWRSEAASRSAAKPAAPEAAQNTGASTIAAETAQDTDAPAAAAQTVQEADTSALAAETAQDAGASAGALGAQPPAADPHSLGDARAADGIEVAESPPAPTARELAETWLASLPADPEDGDESFALPPLPLGRLHPGLPGLRPLYSRLSGLRAALGESSRQRFGARS